MSTFEPMSEEEIRAWWSGGGLCAERMAKTALHHLARAKAAEEQNERAAKATGLVLSVLSGVVTLDADEDTIVDAANKAAAEHRQMRADHLDAVRRVKAAEEACDLAIVERDEAYGQRDAAARFEEQIRGDRDDCRSLIADLRTILGATDGEMLSDAARRVATALASFEEADLHKTVLDEVRTALAVPYGESVVAKAKWIMEARAMGHKMQGEREDEIDRLRKRVAELDAAETEPAQTFRPPISITVRHACDHPFAEVTIGAIQDPAFLALPMGARLALVVTRD